MQHARLNCESEGQFFSTTKNYTIKLHSSIQLSGGNMKLVSLLLKQPHVIIKHAVSHTSLCVLRAARASTATLGMCGVCVPAPRRPDTRTHSPSIARV